jgi:hypothetical protein
MLLALPTAGKLTSRDSGSNSISSGGKRLAELWREEIIKEQRNHPLGISKIGLYVSECLLHHLNAWQIHRCIRLTKDRRNGGEASVLCVARESGKEFIEDEIIPQIKTLK